jgi:hypothetical protein
MASPDQNCFLKAVTHGVPEVADEFGVISEQVVAWVRHSPPSADARIRPHLAQYFRN